MHRKAHWPIRKLEALEEDLRTGRETEQSVEIEGRLRKERHRTDSRRHGQRVERRRTHFHGGQRRLRLCLEFAANGRKLKAEAIDELNVLGAASCRIIFGQRRTRAECLRRVPSRRNRGSNLKDALSKNCNNVCLVGTWPDAFKFLPQIGFR